MTLTRDELDACARRLDAALRPLNDAELARRGITREQLLAQPAPRRPPAPAAQPAGDAAGEEAAA